MGAHDANPVQNNVKYWHRPLSNTAGILKTILANYILFERGRYIICLMHMTAVLVLFLLEWTLETLDLSWNHAEMNPGTLF